MSQLLLWVTNFSVAGRFSQSWSAHQNFLRDIFLTLTARLWCYGHGPTLVLFFPLSSVIFICISGAFDDDLSVFAVIMCAALAQQKQLRYKPDIKTKLDACVPQHLGHQCPINTSSQSISLPSPLRSLMKPWVGKRGSGRYSLHARIWDILTLALAFTHTCVEAVQILAASL